MPGDQEASFRWPAGALLGPEIEHRDSLREMLEGRVHRIAWIPDSQSFQRTRNTPRGKASRLLDQLWGTRDRDYLKAALQTIDESESRFIIAYWGTAPLPDLVAIKKARPQLKIVLMLLCYPLALTTLGIYRQNLYIRRAAPYLDGIMYPSEEMAEYFRTRVLGRRAVPSVVIPPCWPADYQATARPQPIQERPNILYVGRTDLGRSTIHVADDIRPLMRAILDSGIVLYHGYSPETDDGHPNRQPFRAVPLPDLVKSMAAYDASLMVYNTEACARDDRFALTVPDRLITSVAGGVPVAIPARGYAASKSYLKDYPAVIAFDSSAELQSVLADRARVADLRNAAWDARRNYTARRQGPALCAFLNGL